MNDHDIIKAILNDIETMPLEDLKASLREHAYGAIYKMSALDPYELIYSIYTNSVNYSLANAVYGYIGKGIFKGKAIEIDTDRLIADKLTSAANDGYYMMAA